MPGRPRDPELEQRLLSATWSLLTRDGYDALTLTKVAAQAQAHRTDLYRRWSSKPLLVADTLAAHLPPVPAFDTGSLLGDLEAYVGALAESWSAPWVDGLLGLVADLRNDPEAELAFRAMAEGRGRHARDAVQRAVDRGELTGALDLSLLGDLLEGPLMHRRVIGRQPLTADYLALVARTAHQVLLTAGARA